MPGETPMFEGDMCGGDTCPKGDTDRARGFARSQWRPEPHREEWWFPMTRFVRVFVLSIAVLLISAGTVLADSPHQVGQTSVNQSGNSLTIAASIAGLGNVPSVTLNLSGTVDVFSRCYNRGGNKPQADNKQETLAVNSTATFPVRNGRTNASFTITPLSTLTCPGNQVVRIESFSYDLTISYQGDPLVHVSG